MTRYSQATWAGGGAILVLEAISVRYGRIAAVHDFSLQIAPGETVAVLGPNGAGKTSLGRAVMGLVPHGGRVRPGERDVTGTRPDQRAHAGLGYVPSSARVFPGLSVAQNLEVAARPGTDPWAFPDERFPILREKARQPARELSGGQQQLLSIARALASSPAYLILDEPSAGLAPVVVEEVFEVLRTLSGTSIAVLLLEQNAALAVELADRCVVLAEGEIRLEGTAEELSGSRAIEELYLGGGRGDAALGA